MNQHTLSAEPQAFKNPSYDKSLPSRERLADFLGKYHVILNGVVKHDPFMKSGEDGSGMCCEDHKLEILDFVDKLVAQAVSEAVEAERKKFISDLEMMVVSEGTNYRGDSMVSLDWSYFLQIREKYQRLLTPPSPERKE